MYCRDINDVYNNYGEDSNFYKGFDKCPKVR